MRKIVQLDEYDYNKLADLAKLNEKEIEKHAIDLWKEKGVAEITIKIDTGRDYNDYCRIDCSTYLFYKDNRFYIPENVRERFRKIVKENVMWDIEERFGDLKGAINKFNREAKWIGYTKFVLYMIALSGWAVAAVLTVFNMERYRIVRETKYSGCIPITTYFVQVRKESRLSYGWTNIKGFDTYKKAKELLDILYGN